MSAKAIHGIRSNCGATKWMAGLPVAQFGALSAGTPTITQQQSVRELRKSNIYRSQGSVISSVNRDPTVKSTVCFCAKPSDVRDKAIGFGVGQNRWVNGIATGSGRPGSVCCAGVFLNGASQLSSGTMGGIAWMDRPTIG